MLEQKHNLGFLCCIRPTSKFSSGQFNPHFKHFWSRLVENISLKISKPMGTKNDDKGDNAAINRFSSYYSDRQDATSWEK